MPNTLLSYRKKKRQKLEFHGQERWHRAIFAYNTLKKRCQYKRKSRSTRAEASPLQFLILNSPKLRSGEKIT